MTASLLQTWNVFFYKTRTNGKWNLENYDAYAMLIYFNQARYLETTIVVTRGQKKFEKLKKENNDDSKTLFITNKT